MAGSADKLRPAARAIIDRLGKEPALATLTPDAGTAAPVTRYAEKRHGFVGFPEQLAHAGQALDDMGAALRAAFA